MSQGTPSPDERRKFIAFAVILGTLFALFAMLLIGGALLDFVGDREGLAAPAPLSVPVQAPPFETK